MTTRAASSLSWAAGMASSERRGSPATYELLPWIGEAVGGLACLGFAWGCGSKVMVVSCFRSFACYCAGGRPRHNRVRRLQAASVERSRRSRFSGVISFTQVSL